MAPLAAPMRPPPMRSLDAAADARSFSAPVPPRRAERSTHTLHAFEHWQQSPHSSDVQALEREARHNTIRSAVELVRSSCSAVVRQRAVHNMGVPEDELVEALLSRGFNTTDCLHMLERFATDAGYGTACGLWMLQATPSSSATPAASTAPVAQRAVDGVSAFEAPVLDLQPRPTVTVDAAAAALTTFRGAGVASWPTRTQQSTVLSLWDAAVNQLQAAIAEPSVECHQPAQLRDGLKHASKIWFAQKHPVHGVQLLSFDRADSSPGQPQPDTFGGNMDPPDGGCYSTMPPTGAARRGRHSAILADCC